MVRMMVLVVACGAMLATPVPAQPHLPYEQTPLQLDQTIRSVHRAHLVWRERLVTLARAHLGQPYELYLLGEGPFETIDPQPIWRHDRSDCVTFVEHILAYSLANNLRDAVRLLQRIRYANGNISVLTRNHYTEADWNVNNGWLLEDITESIGGQAIMQYPLKVDRAKFFRERYKLDTDNPVQELMVAYLPLTAVDDVKSKLQDGDIVDFVYGQDEARWVGHLGFVIIHDGVPSLLHSQAPKVRLESMDDAITRMSTAGGRLKGFKFLRVRPDAMDRLRNVDGDAAPRVTVPDQSRTSFAAYLQELPGSL